MQEEVTGKTVTLIVNGAKMSEQVFEKAVRKFLEEIRKSRQPKIYRGKQTLKQLASQNAGLANIEISNKNIKAFTHVAKKYHVDFALKKDTAAEQPRYLVFFKSRDATPSRRPSRSLPAAGWAGRKNPPSGTGWSRRRNRWSGNRSTGHWTGRRSKPGIGACRDEHKKTDPDQSPLSAVRLSL